MSKAGKRERRRAKKRREQAPAPVSHMQELRPPPSEASSPALQIAPIAPHAVPDTDARAEPKQAEPSSEPKIEIAPMAIEPVVKAAPKSVPPVAAKSVPPATAARKSVPPRASAEIEIDLTAEVESIAPLPPKAVLPPPTIPPIPRMRSGIVPRSVDTSARALDVADETLAEHLVGLQSYYRESDRRTGERASELRLEDRSLYFDNPLAASPLVPPPEPPPPPKEIGRRVASIAGIALIALSSSAGVWLFLQGTRSNRSPDVAEAKAAENVPSTVKTDENAIAEAPPSAPAAIGVEASPAEASPEPGASPEPSPSQEPSQAQTQSPSQEQNQVQNSSPSRGRKLNQSPSPNPSLSPTPDLVPNPRVARGKGRLAPSATTGVNPSPSAPPPAQASNVPGAPALADTFPDPASSTPEPAVPAELPKLPSPRAVRASFEKIHAKLSACVGGRRSITTIRATIESSGKIAFASVDGGFQSAEERACMARAVLELQFPPFKQSVFKVAYPLVL